MQRAIAIPDCSFESKAARFWYLDDNGNTVRWGKRELVWDFEKQRRITDELRKEPTDGKE